MPNYAISTRFSGEEGALLDLQFDEVVYILNALSQADTLANRTALPDIDHILFYASDSKQTFVGTAGAWQNVGPRRGSATISAGSSTVAVTLTPNEPNANYRISLTGSAEIGGLWYTSKAASGFTINMATVITTVRSGTETISGSSTSAAVSLPPAEANTSYEIGLTPGFEADRVWYTNKATSGFTVNALLLLPPSTIDELGSFDSQGAPGGGGAIDWILHRAVSTGAPTGGATVDWMLTRD